MSTKRTVLVTGATGQQGGAVARALRARGHHVRALTRTPGSDAAKALARSGAEIVAGDFADRDGLAKAADGADTVFLMGTPFESGTDAETEHGINAVEALKAARAGHVIYASVASADRATGIPHFESKAAVERHLVASGLPYTISAPVAFMDNVVSAWQIGPLKEGVLAMAMPGSRPLQQIAVADIGRFVTVLAERREAVFRRRFDIAGDELSGEQAAAILSRAGGRPVTYRELPIAAVAEQNADAAAMFAWFDRVGYATDIAGLRKAFPEIAWHGYPAWAHGIDWDRVLGTAEPASHAA